MKRWVRCAMCHLTYVKHELCLACKERKLKETTSFRELLALAADPDAVRAALAEVIQIEHHSQEAQHGQA